MRPCARVLCAPPEDPHRAFGTAQQQEEGRGDSGSSPPRGVVQKVEMVKKCELDALVIAKLNVKNFPLNGSIVS